MKPVLFEYAGLVFSAYPFMMAVGAALLFIRSAKDSKTFQLDRRLTIWVLILAWFAGWLGARLFFVVEHRSLLAGPWWVWLASPGFSGFSAYGGIVGGVIGAALAARFAGVPVLGILDVTSVGACHFGVAGRIGCFLAGCCHGTPLDWGVVFPAGSPAAQRYGEGVAVHPTQLYEAAAFIAIAVVLARQTGGAPGERFCWLMISYASVRLLLSVLRGDALVPYSLLSPAQWISLCVLAGATCLLAAVRRYSWRAAL